MSQLIALGVRTPQIDPAGSIMKGVQARQGMQKSQLNDLKIREETGKAQALQGYRSGLQADDPNAAAALKGYPELEAQFDQVHDSITDRKEKKAFEKKAKMLGEAARALSGYPEGSPERKQMGDALVEDLVKREVLSLEQAQQAQQTGYTNLFLSQYLTLDQWVQRKLGEPEAAKKAEKEALDKEYKRSQIEKNRADAAKKGSDAESRARLVEAQIKRAEAAAKKDMAAIDNPEGMSDTKAYQWIEDKKIKLRDSLLKPHQYDAPNPEQTAEIEAQVEKAGAKWQQELDAMRGGDKKRSTSSPSSQSAKGNKALFAKNPTTGERMQWDYDANQWVPASQ